MILLLLLQTDSTGILITKPETQSSMSVLDFIMKGGVILIPIAILFLISIYILTERLIYIAGKSKADPNYWHQLKLSLNRGDLEAAKALNNAKNTALSNILNAGIDSIGQPMEEVNMSMEDMASYELGKMEKSIAYLGIIAGIAPMLGFIGTISGIIRIFYDISLSDNISIGIIAGGLYEKMITSGAGLLVGVFAYTAYHFLHVLIDRFSLKMEGSVIEFKTILRNPA